MYARRVLSVDGALRDRPTERAREDEKLFGQRTSVAPHDVPSQVVRAVTSRPSLSGPIVTAVPGCLSEMFTHIHNDGVQPVSGGLAVGRASDCVFDERTTGQAGRVRGPVTTSCPKRIFIFEIGIPSI